MSIPKQNCRYRIGMFLRLSDYNGRNDFRCVCVHNMHLAEITAYDRADFYSQR